MPAKKKNSGGRKDAVGANAALRDAEQFLLPTYKRPPIVFTHGRGGYVFDARGKKYLDFLGGIAVNALGHAHPRIVRVIRREAARAIHLSNLYHNAYQGPPGRPRRSIASWRSRILFMAALSAPSALPPRKSIACPSRPSFPAPSSCVSTTSLISTRNSTIPSALSSWKQSRVKAASI